MTTKLKRTLALVLAGGALAIGVPAALAAGGGGGDGDGTSQQPSNSSFIQDEGGQNRQDRGDQNRPDRGDCPEKDGQQGGSSESSGGETAL